MNNGEKCCIISLPRLESLENGKTRLISNISFNGIEKEIFFSVENRYAGYLCNERADAFVIGILPHAMRAGLDIVCNVPVGERLKYQLETYLIPSLVKYSRSLYASRIIASVDSTLIKNVKGVGAGISCGVDSLHIIKNYINPQYAGMKLTHLVLNNVGAFSQREQYEWMSKRAQKFSQEIGLDLILTDSNIAELFPLNFIYIHSFRNMFAVYALQKLWSIFFYGSSGLDFQQNFSLCNNDINDAAHYDLLSLDTFSTQNLKIYSEGGALERYDKIADIIDFDLSHKYLQVCVSDIGPNCGRCFKCIRTLLILDALGALDKFYKVFNIEYYKRHRSLYLQKLYWSHICHSDNMLNRVYEKFKNEISFKDKAIVYCDMLKSKLKQKLA